MTQLPFFILVAWLSLGYVSGPAQAAETEAADPFSGAFEVFRFSFENDQDLDYDLHPDDWTRRIGRDFPHYLKVEIDRGRGSHGRQSLKFEANGGPAILYSPVWRVDPLHAYVFQGVIKTEGLVHDAAVVSVSFLNHKRQRIQRFLATPVSGTHANWRTVRIGPISPNPDARFVVVGCHLVNGASADIQGGAWFDNLWLGKLPQLELVSNYHTQFVEPGSPVTIETRISGLDPLPPLLLPAVVPLGLIAPTILPIPPTYHLELQLLDSRGQVRMEWKEKLSANQEPHRLQAKETPKPHVVKWNLDPQEYGIYRVQAALSRDNSVIFEKQATFAVLDLVDERADGEFGWSFPRGTGNLPLKDLVEVSLQGGINWLKYPVWNSVHSGNAEHSASISRFFDFLNIRRIKPVGLLNDPPSELRRKFAPNWTGISEVFTQSPRFWSASVDPVLAQYSSTVQYWQLGDDRDGSFVGIQDFPETLSAVKREFDRIGRDTRIGVHWSAEAPWPDDKSLSRAFLSFDQPEGQPALTAQANSPNSLYQKWVVLKPLAKSKHTPEERGEDLVKRMVAAKMGKPDAIFAYDVLDEEYGLLNPDGSPTLLFLPWRTTALALQGARYLGSLPLAGGSRNFLFESEGRKDVVMFIWNEERVTESVYLGEPTEVTAINLWGEQTRLITDPETGQQNLAVGPMPLVIRGCSQAVARWRLAMNFETGRLASATGVHREHIIGRNTFDQGVSGTVTLQVPADWDVEPRAFPLHAGRGEEYRLPIQITLPPNATLGIETLTMEVEIDADRKYRFRVVRPLQIGLGDVVMTVVDRRLENGLLEIEQTLINKTAPLESLDFECSLFIPGSKRQNKLITKQGAGQSVKLYYAPNADALKGQELWIRAEQTNGRRVLNYRWIVGKDW